MAGHVPRFDAPNAGNFTETFDTARSGGRSGSGGEARRGSKPEDTTNNPPPTRRAPQRGRPAATASAPARRPTRTNPKPVPVSEGGDSHIPTFGKWNEDQNYTGIFQAASKARKGEAGGPAPEPASGDKGSGGNGDLYKTHSKKRSSSWCCFGA